MRNRLSGAVLLVALLLPAAISTPASAAPPADTIVLAAEGGGAVTGPEPRTADDPDNEFRPKAYEEPWTYWLGVFILVGTLPALLLVGYLYYVLVHRHRDDTEKAGSR